MRTRKRFAGERRVVEDVRVERATGAIVLRLDDEKLVVSFNADKPPDRQIDFGATGDAVQER